MNAVLFPGQGAQFVGMGKDLYEQYPNAKALFESANQILGFSITEIMFSGTDEELKQTKVTQPAVFLHSVILSMILDKVVIFDMTAGHSLGEFSALVASGALSFDDGLHLVSQRAKAMQLACDVKKGAMAAVLGLEDQVVEKVCAEIEGVVPANYNCPGQLVISGAIDAVEKACSVMREMGARRALILPVGGAFHSPLMEPAREQLASAIEATRFRTPNCAVYQNVTASAIRNPNELKKNIIVQLTGPVKWTQSMHQMQKDGATQFTEVGPGKVLQGLVKKINRKLLTVNGADLLSSS